MDGINRKCKKCISDFPSEVRSISSMRFWNEISQLARINDNVITSGTTWSSLKMSHEINSIIEEGTPFAISSETIVDNEETDHSRVIIVSRNATASNDNSSVISATNSTAEGEQSSVMASTGCTASGIRAAILSGAFSDVVGNSGIIGGSIYGIVNGNYSQINSSRSSSFDPSTVNGNHSQINATNRATIVGNYSQVNASYGFFHKIIINGSYSQINASGGPGSSSQIESDYSQINATNAGIASATHTQINACGMILDEQVYAEGNNSQINASGASITTGEYAQINACRGEPGSLSRAEGDNSQVNASNRCITSGEFSQINVSNQSTAAGLRTQINTSDQVNLTAVSVNTSVIGCDNTSNMQDLTNVLVVGSSSLDMDGEDPISNSIIMGDGTGVQVQIEAGGDATFSGTVSSSGADYAEYMTNLEEGEIPVGTIVVLDNGKVRPSKAEDVDIPLFTVSATAAIAANNHMHKLDKFGKVIEKSNKRRSNKPELYSLVAFVGVVYVRVFEDISSGKYVGPNGLASNDKTNLYCLYMSSKYDSGDGFGVAKCIIR